MLARRSLTEREQAFWRLVEASHLHDPSERSALVDAAAKTLGPDEFYNALSVIALFNFYNKFVDVGGGAELTHAGNDTSGGCLSHHRQASPSRFAGRHDQGQ